MSETYRSNGLRFQNSINQQGYLVYNRTTASHKGRKSEQRKLIIWFMSVYQAESSVVVFKPFLEITCISECVAVFLFSSIRQILVIVNLFGSYCVCFSWTSLVPEHGLMAQSPTT